MIGLASAASLILGATIAGLASGAGMRAQSFETCGGVLLLSGLVLLGSGLPLFR